MEGANNMQENMNIWNNPVSNLEIKEMNGFAPPFCEKTKSFFYWYKVNNDKELLIVRIFHNHKGDYDIINYPEIICIEKKLQGEIKIYKVSDIIEKSKDFYNKIGYEMMLEKNK